MRILFSIIINALILFAITYLLAANPERGIDAWVVLWCWACSYTSFDALKIYLMWGIILWLINVTIRPILKILSLPLFFIIFWLVVFVINAVVLWILNFIINDLLIIPWISYQINWFTNFIIAVAIFTILNMFYSLLFTKK